MLEPFITWSESIDHVFVNVEVNNITKENIQIEKNLLNIKVINDEGEYSIIIPLINNINIEKSGFKKNNKIYIYLRKEEAINWKRLSNIKNSKITYDWDKYTIEDDEDLMIEELSDSEIYYETSESEASSEDEEN